MRVVRVDIHGSSIIIALCAWMTLAAACGGDDNVVCPGGLVCPVGWSCAAAQDVCVEGSCGDAVLDRALGEECDDGNVLDGDGCDGLCRLEESACAAPADRTAHTYVMDTMVVPTSQAEAIELGLDIDGREPIGVENALGQVLATLTEQTGLATDQAAAIDSGAIIHLLGVQSDSLENSECVTVGVYLGTNPSDPPCAGPSDPVCGGHLGGTSSFDIDPSTPTGSVFGGDILGRGLRFGPGEAPGVIAIQMKLGIDTSPMTLPLVGARAEIGQVAADGLMQGMLGGAIRDADTTAVFLPGLHAVIEELVTRDCTEPAPRCCPPGSEGEQYLYIFNTNDDCIVTLEEVLDNQIIDVLVAPDVDLFDQDGAYNPNVDGVRDSLSIGFGFSATAAEFTIP